MCNSVLASLRSCAGEREPGYPTDVFLLARLLRSASLSIPSRGTAACGLHARTVVPSSLTIPAGIAQAVTSSSSASALAYRCSRSLAISFSTIPNAAAGAGVGHQTLETRSELVPDDRARSRAHHAEALSPAAHAPTPRS